MGHPVEMREHGRAGVRVGSGPGARRMDGLLALRTLAGELVEGDCRATLIRDSLARVDPDAKVVVTDVGGRSSMSTRRLSHPIDTSSH